MPFHSDQVGGGALRLSLFIKTLALDLGFYDLLPTPFFTPRSRSRVPGRN